MVEKEAVAQRDAAQVYPCGEKEWFLECGGLLFSREERRDAESFILGKFPSILKGIV